MKRQEVTSSLIKSIGYDAEQRVLEVEFSKGGKVYQYADVPPAAHAALMGAESVGKHFLQVVKPAGYAYTLLPAAEASPAPAADVPATV